MLQLTEIHLTCLEPACLCAIPMLFDCSRIAMLLNTAVFCQCCYIATQERLQRTVAEVLVVPCFTSSRARLLPPKQLHIQTAPAPTKLQDGKL